MRHFILITFLFVGNFGLSQRRTDDSFVVRDTLRINNEKFIRLSKDERPLALTTITGEIVVDPEDYYHRFEFTDIDADGDKDLSVSIVSNIPNQCDTYLFDSKNKRFKHLENSDLRITIIKVTEYCFTYNRAGCADLNWESHLGKIDNFKLIPIGYMYGRGCDSESTNKRREIKVYKVKNDNGQSRILSETLPYSLNISKFDSKWNFISTYWAKSWQKFQ